MSSIYLYPNENIEYLLPGCGLQWANREPMLHYEKLEKGNPGYRVMKQPSLRQIRYFIAVANAGQVSRAAKELNVSQSALTTAIKQLEETIGTPLFVRHSGGMSPNL